MNALTGGNTIERVSMVDQAEPGTPKAARAMSFESEMNEEPWMPPRLAPQ